MARITVYKNRPFLTLFSWLGGACILGGIASIFSKELLSAYWSVLFGIAILHFCTCRSEGVKVRYNARFVAILILVYQAVQLLEWALMGKLAQFFSVSGLLIPIALAVVLWLPQVKNKPLAAAIACFVLQAVELVGGIALLGTLKNAPAGTWFFMLLPMFLPGLLGLILILRGRGMYAHEGQKYVF